MTIVPIARTSPETQRDIQLPVSTCCGGKKEDVADGAATNRCAFFSDGSGWVLHSFLMCRQCSWPVSIRRVHRKVVKRNSEMICGVLSRTANTDFYVP